MKSYRVVISGFGIISSAGADNESFAGTIVRGERALFAVTAPEVSHFNARFAGIIQSDPEKHPLFDSNAFADADRFVKLASIAARQAVINAGLEKFPDSERAGLFLGTCSGPMLSIEEEYKRQMRGEKTTDKDVLLKRQYYSAAVKLAQYFKIRGAVCTVTTACSAFTAAVAAASDLICTGVLDIVLVGGSDSLSLTTLAGFAGLKATHDSVCAPFSVPPGLNLGEASGFVVLERRESACERNADIKGEILGSGMSNDAYHSSAPDPAGKGAALSMQQAIIHSGISPEQISFVSAHGTGTVANDKAETKALIKVFGDRASEIPMSSLKGVTGHCLGAAGAVETVATLLCAERGVYPSSVGFTEARDGCSLDYVPECGRPWNRESVFVKNNFAFGGNNASLVIGTGEKSWGSEKDLGDDPVCITGIGTVTPDNGALSEREFAGRGMYRFRECSLNGAGGIDKRIDPRAEKSARMAAVAALKALSSAGIPERQASRMNLGLFMNIAQGSTFAEREHITSLYANNFSLSQVNVFPYIVPNSVTGTVCRMLSLTGHNTTFCNGHGASLNGLAYARAALQNNHVPMLLCGSVDDMSDNGTLDCILSEYPDMKKIVPAEGSAMVMLEKLSHAKERGAKPLCIIHSVVMRFSYDPDKKENYIYCINKALSEAGITARQIAVVCCNTLCDNSLFAVKTALGSATYTVFDCREQTGYAPASLPLFNISSILENRVVDVMSEKKYILTFFNASHANDCAIVMEVV